MSRNYSPTEQLFISEWLPVLVHDQKENAEWWSQKHGEKTPLEVAEGYVNDHTDVFRAFVVGLGIQRPNETVVDQGLWSAHVDPENRRKVSLQSNDFDADVAIYAEVTGDFADAGMKLSYARRLARALNEVSIMNRVPPTVDDKVMGYVEVYHYDNAKRPQMVFANWMPDLVPGKYAVYMTPVQVAPDLSTDQNLLHAAKSILSWSRGLFLDSDNPRTGRRRKYALFDNIPTPEEFKRLAQAVALAQGQAPNGVTPAP